MTKVDLVNVIQLQGRAILSLDGKEFSVDLDDLRKVVTDYDLTPKPQLRPSSLPKLAECACYESSPVAGPAAERGTRMDTAYRALMMEHDKHIATGNLDAAEREAVEWAVEMTKVLCGSAKVIVDKEQCRFPSWHPRVSGGEADAICPEKGKLFDLKSGQIRNYWEQQAAYAVSIMEREFLDELTCHLLFCDRKEIVTRRFTYYEAKALINDTVTGIDTATGPNLCEYCEWCAKCDTCPLRNQVAKQAVELTKSADLDESFAAICADNGKLSEFLKAAAVLDSYAKKGKSVLQERIQGGESVPGWKLINRKGTDTVAADKVRKYINIIGAGNVLNAYGPLKADKLRDLWAEALPGKEFPEEIVTTGASSSYIKSVKIK